MKLSQKIRRTVVFWIARFFYKLFNLLPYRLAQFVAGWAGLAAWNVIRRDQRLIYRHLTLCYNGQLTPREKINLGQRLFINSGRNLADIVRNINHYDSELKDLIEIQGLEHLDNAYKQGRGVIAVSAHLGNFELLAVFLAKLGYKIGVVSRPLADGNLNNLLIEHRKKAGVVNFYASDSPVGMVKWLKSGGVVGVLIDTDSTRVRGEFLPVFGRPSKVPVGQTIMALEMGVPLIPMACVRNGTYKYRVIIRPEIPINKTGNENKDIYDTTLKCSLELESLIKQYPDQWIWMHNRWRTPPKEKLT